MDDTAKLVQQHYEAAEDAADLVSKVARMLEALPDGPVSAFQVAGLDQFHVRGLAATKELAALAEIGREMTVLDAGSGLGGPSRFLASAYGCAVTGVDLTPSFVAVSQLLAERTGLSDLVRYKVGNLLALPFKDAQFDLVWTQHVVMNIQNRRQLYQEFQRVLKPGGILAFYDVLAAHDDSEPHFPVPWAESSAASFLLTPAKTKAALAMAGFTVRIWSDVTAETLVGFSQTQPAAAPGFSLATVIGPRFGEMAANLARSLREGRISLVMGICGRS